MLTSNSRYVIRNGEHIQGMHDMRKERSADLRTIDALRLCRGSPYPRCKLLSFAIIMKCRPQHASFGGFVPDILSIFSNFVL